MPSINCAIIHNSSYFFVNLLHTEGLGNGWEMVDVLLVERKLASGSRLAR